MTKSVKRIGVVPSIKSDWTEEYELMRSALRHIKLALKKGTEGQFDAKQMQKHFKSVNGVYSNISDWVASKAKLVEPSTGPARATESKSPELSRFAALHAGGYHDFVCSRDTNSGKGITSPWLTLKAGNGKEWAIRYKVPVFGQNTGSGGLATNDRQDLTGTKMNVRFNKLGHPVSIKNTANGNFCEVIEWRVTGYGW